MPPSIEEDDDDSRDILIHEELLDNYSFSLPENESFHFDIPLSSRPPAKPIDGNTGISNIKMMGDVSEQKDSDSLMKEIDLFCTLDYPMPPGIVDKDYDSEKDILIPKDLPSNNTLSFVAKESVHFDIPLFSRPPAKPPDGDTGILNIKMMDDISDQITFMHKLMITLASNQEKSPDLLSHRCGTVKQINTHRSHLNTCLISFDLKQALRGRQPMLIFLGFFFLLSSIPEFMKILANGFHYLKSSSSPLFNLGIMYPDLID
nr:hypothetical protein [Tanacetum cinerariifolium]